MALSINECTIHLNTVRIFEGGGVKTIQFLSRYTIMWSLCMSIFPPFDCYVYVGGLYFMVKWGRYAKYTMNTLRGM